MREDLICAVRKASGLFPSAHPHQESRLQKQCCRTNESLWGLLCEPPSCPWPGGMEGRESQSSSVCCILGAVCLGAGEGNASSWPRLPSWPTFPLLRAPDQGLDTRLHLPPRCPGSQDRGRNSLSGQAQRQGHGLPWARAWGTKHYQVLTQGRAGGKRMTNTDPHHTRIHYTIPHIHTTHTYIHTIPPTYTHMATSTYTHMDTHICRHIPYSHTYTYIHNIHITYYTHLCTTHIYTPYTHTQHTWYICIPRTYAHMHTHLYTFTQSHTRMLAHTHKVLSFHTALGHGSLSSTLIMALGSMAGTQPAGLVMPWPSMTVNNGL